MCWGMCFMLVLKSQGSKSIKSRLPKPEEFTKALYTLDIGQNDLAAGFKSMSDDQVLASIPNILNQFDQAVQVSPDSNSCLYVWFHLLDNKFISLVFHLTFDS